MRARPEQGGCRCGNSSSTRVVAATAVATAGMVAATYEYEQVQRVCRGV
jgi:hypothetical protein